MSYCLASDTGSSRCRLTSAFSRRVEPPRSTCVTRLQRYDELVRPFASHRYSAPHGSTTWSSPFASCRRHALGIEATGSHVPHGSQDQGHAAFMPDASGAVIGTSPQPCLRGEIRP